MKIRDRIKEFRRVKASELLPHPANWRVHSDEQKDAMRGLLAEVGIAGAVLAYETDEGLRLIDGHLRTETIAANAEVPVLVLDVDHDEAKKILATFDPISAMATADADMLRDLLNQIETENPSVEAMLRELGEESGIEFDDEIEEGLTDPDEVPEPPDDPVTKPGDLWLLGEHRLLCGDSTNAEDVKRLMGGENADLCFTSPPYGAGNVAKLRDHYVPGAKKRESFYDNHDDNPDSWQSLMSGWYDAWRPVSECVVCNVQMLADNKRALVAWLAERANDLCDVIVWDKINAAPQMQANVLSNTFEFCFVFGGNASRSIPFADFHGTISNVLRLDPRGKNDYSDKHRAVFPVDLPTWFINTLCTKASSVVDPFCGTGTTLIAAEQLGRKCFGMEISCQYSDVICQRWAKFTGKNPVLEETGETFDQVKERRDAKA